MSYKEWDIRCSLVRVCELEALEGSVDLLFTADLAFSLIIWELGLEVLNRGLELLDLSGKVVQGCSHEGRDFRQLTDKLDGLSGGGHLSESIECGEFGFCVGDKSSSAGSKFTHIGNDSWHFLHLVNEALDVLSERCELIVDLVNGKAVQ